VNKAVITHAHSDHARAGSSYYLCHRLTRPLLELRLGPGNYQGIEWNETLFLNGVKISLHPAGHIIGSSQVRIEYNGEVWVVSGDYKTENDGISGVFEPVRCHVFVTESTFSLPIYHWKPQEEIFSNIQNWVLKEIAAGRNPVLIAYSLGKAQRLLSALQSVVPNIFVHGAVWNVHQALVRAGVALPEVKKIELGAAKVPIKDGVVIAPSGAEESPWIKRFNPYAVGVCSGWMQVRGNFRRKNVDAGFALSDHADWKGLLSAIEATGAQKVFVTHGFQAALSRYLNERGIEAAEVKTEFGEEEVPLAAVQEEVPKADAPEKEL
jgi:putative mRNA 3-end processing factor